MIAGLAVAALATAGCGGDEQPERGAAVTVKTFMFGPDPLRVDAGTTVTWSNADTAVHTVTSGTRKRPDGRFDARLAESGGEFSRTFDRPGRYRYFCSLHSGPGMEAEVIVG